MNNPKPRIENIQKDVRVAGSGGAGLRGVVGALEKGVESNLDQQEVVFHPFNRSHMEYLNSI